MSETDVAHTKPHRTQSLFESRGGSRVTKPIYSNSAKRYSLSLRGRRLKGKGKGALEREF